MSKLNKPPFPIPMESQLFSAASLIEPSSTIKDLHSLDCETVTLDSVLEQKGKVDFIKIDVEGFEKSVFSGATSILAKWKPDLLFECECRHIGNDRVSEVIDPLLKLGYDGRLSVLKD